MDLNSYVLENIFSMLDYSSLLSCRNVNKLWLFEANRILKRMDIKEVGFNNFKWFLVNLSKKKQILKHTESHFLFESWKLTNERQIYYLSKEIFPKFGHFIKKININLDNYYYWINEACFSDLAINLQKTLPYFKNLEILELTSKESYEFYGHLDNRKEYILDIPRPLIKKLILSDAFFYNFRDFTYYILESPFLEKITFLINLDHVHEIYTDSLIYEAEELIDFYEECSLEHIKKQTKFCKPINREIKLGNSALGFKTFNFTFCAHLK